MHFKPIQAPTSVDLFMDQIKTAILTGALQPGEKLPSERELCQQLKVSRAVINTGFRRLAALHFITMQPRKGNFVADYWLEGGLATLNEIINFRNGNYRPSLLKSIFEVRLSLEMAIFKLATQRQDTRHLQQATQILDQIELTQDATQLASLYFDFIHTMALASGNAVYPMLITNFRPIYETLGRWLFEEVTITEMSHHHQQELKELQDVQAGNLSAVEQDVQAFIQWTLTQLLAIQ